MDVSGEEISVPIKEDEEYSLNNLKRCSYRFLQQTAKALSLPSNVKKVYLVDLIHTKKYRSPQEVDLLVKKVRLERNQSSMVRKKAKRRKKHVQSMEVSSTSNSTSPPITSTPKRHVLVTHYSPEQNSPLKYPQTASRIVPTNSSDRVLRSFNRVKKPSYLVNNTIFGFIKTGTEARKETRVNIVKEKYRKFDRICVTKSAASWKNDQEVLTHRSVQTSPRPKLRIQRRISGIYPLNNEIPNVTIRRADGTLTKLNAIIQKQAPNYNRQEIINDIRNSPLLSIEPRPVSPEQNYQQRPVQQNLYTPDLNSNCYKENDVYSEYYHKKIRAEQVRSRRESVMCDSEGTLPRINEVFSNFNNMYYNDLTQPIYVQVHEPEIASIPIYISDPCLQHQGPIILEKFYNLKNIMLTSQPPIRRTTTKTNTVFSTPLIVTPLHVAYSAVQPSPPVRNNYDTASMADSQQYTDPDQETPRVQDFFRNFRCQEEQMHADFRCSSEETLTYQELGAISLPEKQMVEDALELISQDGDYMERIGMDEKMQCILCDWAGPRFILEFHIRKEHASDILPCCRPDVSITYSLGRLASSRRWLARLLDHAGALYVLLAKYEDPDCFMAALATLSELDTLKSGSMTIYNKVTGEPYTWKGEISELPFSMDYDLDLDCFKLELSRMDLLPNSANLRLLNRELVIDSSSKVVVGQPELDNINISVIVNIF
ncbi:uncharacterized protein LOC113496148 isoform X2 [Trichoplusia ni]|uniref:Uncharacterized protein LOC113496148 isoform X2 n=1 Tax=Trichoplusia ni TaxID=7111 RepID=A0A7E5VS09_TRINI|nr:uncharacterized protein LOC113496148 isoform X2 [Trichoplusia ni]